VGEFPEPARREASRAARQQYAHPAAGVPLSCLTGRVAGPRTEARVGDGAVAVATQGVLAVATRAVVVESAQAVAAVATRVAAAESAPVVAVAADTTNPQLFFVA
jgi:hypothetical protein